MKIKRFNESEQVDISSERIEEMLDNLKQLSSTLDDKGKFKNYDIIILIVIQLM